MACRRQAIIWTNAGILLIGPLGTNSSEILIEILMFSSKIMRLKVSPAKWRPFCLGLNVLRQGRNNRKNYSCSFRSSYLKITWKLPLNNRYMLIRYTQKFVVWLILHIRMEFHWNIHIRNSFIIKPLFPCIEIPIIKTRPWCIYNIMIRRISQIPRCKHISHNAPFCNRNVHTCTFLVFLIQNCALWDMGMVCCWICATRLIVRRHMKRHQMETFSALLAICIYLNTQFFFSFFFFLYWYTYICIWPQMELNTCLCILLAFSVFENIFQIQFSFAISHLIQISRWIKW